MATMSRDEFIAEFHSLFERFDRPLRAQDGIAQSELDLAEARLGIRIPDRLRDYYLLVSNNKPIFHRGTIAVYLANTPEEQLPHGSELSVIHDHLFFCRGDYGGNKWGIPLADLDQPDPPVNVVVDPDADPWQWIPFQDTLSGFLLSLFYYLGTHGGLRYGAVFDSSPELVARIKDIFPVAAVFGNTLVPTDYIFKYEFFGREREMFSVVEDKIWLATGREDWREEVRKELGFDWRLRYPEDFPAVFMNRFQD